MMHDMALFLKGQYDITPTLGLFQGEERTDCPFPQLGIPRLLPKKLVSYNNILASILARKQLKDFDLVLTHTAGFWQTKKTGLAYREPGNLLRLFWNLPIKSKLLYLPALLVAITSIKQARFPIAASKKAEDFFAHIGVNDFLSTVNFIDTSKLPEPQTKEYGQENTFHLLFVGRDDRIKNLSELIAAITDLPENKNIILHIFGQNGTNTNRIHYHGWCTEEEITNFLTKKVHAFVLPSLFEASPLTLLLALMLGVPSIASIEACPDEYKNTVMLAKTKKELQEALLNLLEDYPKHASNATDRSAQIRTTFDKNTVLKKEFDTLFNLIEKRDQTRP